MLYLEKEYNAFLKYASQREIDSLSLKARNINEYIVDQILKKHDVVSVEGAVERIDFIYTQNWITNDIKNYMHLIRKCTNPYLHGERDQIDSEQSLNIGLLNTYLKYIILFYAEHYDTRTCELRTKLLDERQIEEQRNEENLVKYKKKKKKYTIIIVIVMIIVAIGVLFFFKTLKKIRTQSIIDQAIEDYMPKFYNSPELSIGETFKPGAAVWCNGGDSTCYSSDESVATVSDTGLVKAVGRGTAYIVIKSSTGMEEAYFITVN